MKKQKKHKQTNANPVSTQIVTEPTVAEAIPAASQEPVPAVEEIPAAPVVEMPDIPASETEVPTPEAVTNPQEEPAKPARKRSSRQPKSAAAETAEKSSKKRGGRKKDATAETAEPSAKKRSERKTEPVKEKQEKKPLLPRRSKMDIPDSLGIFVQYQGGEVDMNAIVDAVKADFAATSKQKRITTLKLYVKPEEHTAYYVANDSYNGKITF